MKCKATMENKIDMNKSLRPIKRRRKNKKINLK